MPTPARTAIRLALVTMIVACGPGRTTFATHPSVPPAFDRSASDPKALEIADRVVAAAGGQDKWAAAKQIRWLESITRGEVTVELEQAWDRWNGRHHQRLRTPAGDLVVMRPLYSAGGVAFGEKGRNRASLGKEDTERAMAAARERWSFDTTVLFLPFLLHAPGSKLELAGELAEEGQPPYDVLKLTFDPKDPTRTATCYAMVNRTTNQVQRVEIVKAGDPDTKRLGYRAEAWADVSGLKLATVYKNVGTDEVVTFSNITAASEPDETLYVPTTL
jgi:hypothetical protein